MKFKSCLTLLAFIFILCSCGVSECAETARLYPIFKNGLYGYANLKGELVIPICFDHADEFYEGLACVETKGRYGAVNATGNLVIPAVYRRSFKFSEGMAAVCVNDKFGFIDKTGKEIIKPEFEEADSFYEGLARVAVKKGGFNVSGYIDKTGKMAIEPKFFAAGNFRSGLARAAETHSSKYGFIDKTGNWAIAPKFDYASNFSDGLALIESRNMDDEFKRYYIDKTGNAVIKFKYGTYSDFSEGIAAFSRDSKWGFIDKTGKEIVKPQYDVVEECSNGVAIACLGDYKAFGNGKWSFIDKTGKTIYESTYKSRPFALKTAALFKVCVDLNNKSEFSYIDTAGRLVIQPKPDWQAARRSECGNNVKLLLNATTRCMKDNHSAKGFSLQTLVDLKYLKAYPRCNEGGSFYYSVKIDEQKKKIDVECPKHGGRQTAYYGAAAPEAPSNAARQTANIQNSAAKLPLPAAKAPVPVNAPAGKFTAPAAAAASQNASKPIANSTGVNAGKKMIPPPPPPIPQTAVKARPAKIALKDIPYSEYNGTDPLMAKLTRSTNLLVAITKGDLEAAKRFIKEGVSTDIRNSEKKTVLQIATEKGYTEIVEMLRAAGHTK